MALNPFVLSGIAIAALVAGSSLRIRFCDLRDVVKDTFHVVGDVVQGTWRRR